MSKAPAAQLTPAQKRRLAYKSLASESDKDARNKAITDALGETDKHNVETSGKKHVLRDEETGERITFYDPVSIKQAALPSAPNSRSAKRARLKSSRNRKVRPASHPDGRCGNVGCRRCNAQAAEFAAKRKRQRDNPNSSRSRRAERRAAQCSGSPTYANEGVCPNYEQKTEKVA